jgi:UDP-N-acetylglucosamine--dolichyl-phosphate N-acetylglucosaminephosphotransferase
VIKLLLNQFVLLFALVFLITAITTYFWINKAKKAGLTGKDMHKNSEKKVAEMGGITVLLGFIIGIMIYIAIRIFVFQANTYITPLLAILTATLIAGLIGIMDDILGWKIGLRQWQKPLLTLLVAAPIMALNAGHRIMSLPIFGEINLGLLFPLIIIPGFILVGTNGFNMLAGYNGLEAGQGIIILTTLAFFSFMTGSAWLSVVAICMVFALLGFLVFNYYPAKIFPGDTLTYTVGALIAIIAIFANLEKIFLILFIPYIIEFFLKLRGKFKKESFAQITDNGTLIPRYKKIYGLENLFVSILNSLKINYRN